MTEYEVNTGLNLGPENKRFEPGDKIAGDEFEKLVPTKGAREWLISDEHVTQREDSSGSSGKRRASRQQSSSTADEPSAEKPDTSEDEGDDV